MVFAFFLASRICKYAKLSGKTCAKGVGSDFQGRVLCVEPVESIFTAMQQNIQAHAEWCAVRGE